MSEKRTRRSSASKLRAILDGAASVLDIGATAPVVRYKGFEADAEALRGDHRAIGADFRRAKRAAG